MCIKLDQNLPTSLVEALVQLGHDAGSVHLALLVPADPALARRPQREGDALERPPPPPPPWPGVPQPPSSARSASHPTSLAACVRHGAATP
ncbi:hypothetical protein WMF18_30340 [Sorangium sp. So ce315]|uniref:hypothetical protein n=1 Tax=Sorangium sp. So ce315 TaxID=3133299 RepID=UPI003F637AFC